MAGNSQQQKIIVIVGPTASGKSDLAVQLAKQFGGEVVSADSRQVYKGLDIGTGKITLREMQGVPHHLLDVCSAKKVFSAHDFVTRAQSAITEIVSRGNVPIIAGGTGFYIDALLARSPLAMVPQNVALRKKLEQKTTPQLLAQLKRKNPARHADILQKNEQNNRVRLIRAIEVASAPPCPRGTLGHEWEAYDVLWIGIVPSDVVLKKKIHTRLLQRIRQGMVAEASRLHAKRLSYKRMRALGLEYRYLADFLQEKITKDELIKTLTTKIWQYANRQKTYWRRNKDIQWFLPNEERKIEKTVQQFLG